MCIATKEDPVPLSEEELRLLEQMERALSAEDPKFASTLRGHSLRRAAQRRVILAGVAFVAGVGLLMAGVITSLWVLGIIGFLIMLAAATVGVTALRGRPLAARGGNVAHGPRKSHGFAVFDGGRSRRPQRGSSTFMQKVEARWRRRRGGFGW
jgi:UPF0716 family protein affecting phage T7 exclusion